MVQGARVLCAMWAAGGGGIFGLAFQSVRRTGGGGRYENAASMLLLDDTQIVCEWAAKVWLQQHDARRWNSVGGANYEMRRAKEQRERRRSGFPHGPYLSNSRDVVGAIHAAAALSLVYGNEQLNDVGMVYWGGCRCS